MSRPRVLFSSWHFLFDSSNGASISALELLRGLRSVGWDIHVLCSTARDTGDGVDVGRMLKERGIECREVVSRIGGVPFQLDQFYESGINCFVFSPHPFMTEPDDLTGELFLRTHCLTAEEYRPDVVATYGGYGIASRLLRESRSLGAKTVFLLQNFAYDSRKFFNDVDLTIVPSEYSREYYFRRFGIRSFAIPPLMNRESFGFEGAAADRRHALFVNPSPNKGVFFFAGILREVARRRPDIPFLIAEGSSNLGAFQYVGVDLREFSNVFFMRNQPFSSAYYRRAGITLIPSLFRESFCRVAAESLSLGIPVVASDRGALPETAGDAGVLLRIDERFTPESFFVPTAEEVEPWLEELFKLWDDAEYYAEYRARGLRRAAAWEYSKVLRLYEEQLEKLL